MITIGRRRIEMELAAMRDLVPMLYVASLGRPKVSGPMLLNPPKQVGNSAHRRHLKRQAKRKAEKAASKKAL